MKKYFFMAIAVLASLTACQQNEPEATYNDGVIRFKNAPVTRATTVTEGIGNEFMVLGYVNDDVLFNEKAVNTDETKTTTTEWKTSTVKYWADNTPYTFFAVYPSKKITTVDNTKATVGYTNTGDEDLVMAGLSMTSGASKTQTPAHLIFKHALSRVRFSFTNKFTDSQLKVKVENVKLNARNGENATATINSDNTITWTTPSETTEAIDFAFDALTSLNLGDGIDIAIDGVETTDYQYIIPNSTATYTMAADITVYTTDATIHTYKITDAKVVTTGNSFNFEYGNSYTFNMNVTDNLNEITFTVFVEEWKNGEGGNINFDATK